MKILIKIYNMLYKKIKKSPIQKQVITMNKNDIWQLFKTTGKIEYYIKYKNMQNDEVIKEND